MTNKQLKKANEIKEEINTLKAEVWELSGFRKSRLRRILNLPPKKTYKDLYCTANVDIIDSCVVLRKDEIEVLIQYKLDKIEKFEEELKNM